MYPDFSKANKSGLMTHRLNTNLADKLITFDESGAEW